MKYTLIIVIISTLLSVARAEGLTDTGAYVFQTEFSGTIKDFEYVQKEQTANGTDTDVLFVLTEEGVVYRSSDAGRSYTNQSYDLEDHHIYLMRQSPANSDYIYFFSSQMDVHFVTKDAGLTYKATPGFGIMYAFEAHPTNPEWALALTFNDSCIDPDVTSCFFLQLGVTKDQGLTWEIIDTYVKEATWGNAGKYSVPITSIYILESTEKTGTQRNEAHLYNLLRTDDFMQTNMLEVRHCGDIVFSDEYLFALSQVSLYSDEVALWVSSKGGPILRAQFPELLTFTTRFVIFDMSAGSIFIGVWKMNQPRTVTLYKSDISGSKFGLSLPRHTGDIHRIEGLPGVFLANQETLDLQEISLITYNHGLSWRELFADDMHPLIVDYSIEPFSSEYAPGSIIIVAHTGSRVLSMFFSRDAGFHWKEISPVVGIPLITYEGNVIQLMEIEGQSNDSYIITFTEKSNPTKDSWRKLQIPLDFTSVHGMISMPDGHVHLITMPNNETTTVITIDYQLLLHNEGVSVCNNSQEVEVWGFRDALPDSERCFLGNETRCETFQRKLGDISCVFRYDPESPGYKHCCEGYPFTPLPNPDSYTTDDGRLSPFAVGIIVTIVSLVVVISGTIVAVIFIRRKCKNRIVVL